MSSSVTINAALKQISDAMVITTASMNLMRKDVTVQLTSFFVQVENVSLQKVCVTKGRTAKMEQTNKIAVSRINT